MQETDRDTFIQKSKEYYSRIGSIACPAFDGELIYFNKHGFNHLLRKGRKFRDPEEQFRRLMLLRYAPYIISQSHTFSDYKENHVDSQPAYFWTLHRYVHGASIWIVIRKLNCGRKHFFSIMGQVNEKGPVKDL